jgi:hypothetical protein
MSATKIDKQHSKQVSSSENQEMRDDLSSIVRLIFEEASAADSQNKKKKSFHACHQY